MNPRVLVFLRALGLDESAWGRDASGALLRVEVDGWTGDCTVQFMLWIQRRWREWDAERGRKQTDSHSGADHADFDAWLERRFPNSPVQISLGVPA